MQMTWHCHASQYHPTYRICRSWQGLRNNKASPAIQQPLKNHQHSDSRSDFVVCLGSESKKLTKKITVSSENTEEGEHSKHIVLWMLLNVEEGEHSKQLNTVYEML